MEIGFVQRTVAESMELVAAQLREFCSETLNEELADPRSTFSDWLGEVPVSWDLKVLMPWSKLTWKHAFQSARVAVAAVATAKIEKK